MQLSRSSCTSEGGKKGCGFRFTTPTRKRGEVGNVRITESLDQRNEGTPFDPDGEAGLAKIHASGGEGAGVYNSVNNDLSARRDWGTGKEMGGAVRIK